MIKAIILDVDGVVIGEKIGFNSPHPHPGVLSMLRSIRESGVPIILCTAKPHFAVSDIIDGANLANSHITDGGAVLIDPIDKRIITKSLVDKNILKDIVSVCLENNVYTECYTSFEYIIQRSQISGITEKHKHILQVGPTIVDSILNDIAGKDITKVMPIALNGEDQDRVKALLKPFEEKLSISWAVHPVALPLQFAIITSKGVTKKEGAERIIQDLRINFSEVLGVGDSTSDWSFMQLCGYGATLQNGSDEIKKLIEEKGNGKFFVGKSVDENGLLDVLFYFSLQ